MATKKVLVSGATGKQGGALARVLIERGHEVRALTRDPEKPEAEALRGLGIDVVRGDFEDSATIRTALAGMDVFFLVATPYEQGPDVETQEAIAAVDAAKDAGIGYLVYSSVANADQRTGIPHFESKRRVEEHLAQVGVRHAVVAPVWFMENLLGPWMLPDLVQGKVALPMAPDRQLQMIGLQEVARFSAEVIEAPDRFAGRRFDIASDEIPVGDLADVISHAARKKLAYEEVPKQQAREALGDDGVRMYEWFERVGYSADIMALQREHPDVGWRTFEQWAKAQDWTFLVPAAAVHAPR